MPAEDKGSGKNLKFFVGILSRLNPPAVPISGKTPPMIEPAHDVSEHELPVLLTVAAQLVESGWTRNYSAVDGEGKRCSYHSTKAAAFCMLGAIYRVAYDRTSGQPYTLPHRCVVNRMIRYVALCLPQYIPIDLSLNMDMAAHNSGIEGRLGSWNDNYSSQRAVASVLRSAADLAQQDADALPGCRIADFSRTGSLETRYSRLDNYLPGMSDTITFGIVGEQVLMKIPALAYSPEYPSAYAPAPPNAPKVTLTKELVDA